MKKTERSVQIRARTWRHGAGKLFAGSALLGLCLWTGASAGDNPAAPETAQAKAGYSAGYEFGDRLARLRAQGSEVELEAVFRGVIDALSGAEPLMSEKQRRATLEALGTAAAPPATASDGIVDPKLRKRSYHQGGLYDDFLQLNAQREGVVVLPSGVQYEVLTAGSGKQPHAGDTVLVQYVATLTNGSEFDRTDGEATRLALDEIVVPGLREALLLMSEGAKWRVVIPPAMGFGRSGAYMLRRRALVYEIELLTVEAPAKDAQAAAGTANTRSTGDTP
jgi:FKBP-type peptidyl-prolyl cis-trans isomerase FklB